MESESTHPELETALRAYEVEIRDGTERSQQEALRRLRRIRQELAVAALAAAEEDAEQDKASDSGPEHRQAI